LISTEVNKQISVDTVETVKTMASPTPAHAGAGRRIVTIAGNTFREAVRDRVLYNLVLFVLILTALS
jgi:hypothetical protein